MTYQQGLDIMASGRGTKALGKELDEMSKEVIRKEIKAGRPQSLWATQARTYRAWYAIYKYELPEG